MIDYRGSVNDYKETMKITKRQLRRLIREELALFREGTLTFEPRPYGEIKILVDGQEKYLGELVADLLDAGDDDIFYGPQGINDESLKTLLQYRATGDSGGPQGSMLYWDSSVFGDNYNVDSERVIRLWARRHNHQVEELEMERDEWDY